MQILNDIRPENTYGEHSDLIGDGLLDSLDMIILVSELEKAFDIHIEGNEVVPENFDSIGKIVNLAFSKLEKLN